MQGYTEILTQTYGAKSYDSLSVLAQDAVAIFLDSMEGRQRAAQFTKLAVGKPVFVDKPFACAAAARAVILRAQQTQTPIFSCSSSSPWLMRRR